MKILIEDLNEFYNENVRLVKNLMKRESPEEYPLPLKWALQMLYFDGEEWVEICRIDNYPHTGKIESHMHIYGRDEVKKIDLDYKDAKDKIREISERILKDKFKQIINLG